MKLHLLLFLITSAGAFTHNPIKYRIQNNSLKHNKLLSVIAAKQLQRQIIGRVTSLHLSNSSNDQKDGNKHALNIFKSLKENGTIQKMNEAWLALLEKNPAVKEFSEKVTNFLGVLAGYKTIAASFLVGVFVTFSVLFGSVYLDSDPEATTNLRASTLMETILMDLESGYVDNVDSSKLFETGISAMLRSLDPYTEFENVEEAQAMQESITSRYGGIGLVIQQVKDKNTQINNLPLVDDEEELEISGDKEESTNPLNNKIRPPKDQQVKNLVDTNTDESKKKTLQVRAVKALEPYAFRAGVRTGDLILSIDGRTIEDFKDVDEVRNALRGEVGTIAHIQVERDGVGNLDLEVPRQMIKMPDVKLTQLLDDGVGYISLSGFSAEAGLEVRESILYLQNELLENPEYNGQLKGLILDLRGNPGGLLTSAVDVASLFVPKGSDIVSARGRGFPGVLYRSRVDPLIDASQTKIAVLVNGSTASAAEIVSGAIQDLDVGVVVGQDRTYGKGLVQNVQELPYNTALKYTVAKYYTPSGRCIQSVDYKQDATASVNGNGAGYKAIKRNEKERKEYFTKSGRVVKDGGGIEADYKVKAPEASALEVTLLRSGVFQEFASNWSKNYELTNNFYVSDDMYRDFQRFVNEKQQSGKLDLVAIYSGPLKALKKSLEQSKYQGSQSELKLLESDIVREMLKDFDKYSKDIKEDIANAILDRYLPDSMLLSRSLRTDTQVKAVEKLIRNEPAFNKILARTVDSNAEWASIQAKNKNDGVSSTSMSTSKRDDMGVRLNLKW